MQRIILHIDFNSYFATIEQQANPRLRGKPIGVTGGDRMERTVLGTASVEAKALGIKTGMSVGEALRIYPQLILVRGDSDKYLECSKRFLNILKDYSPHLEVFSIDECFLDLTHCHSEHREESLTHVSISHTREILRQAQDDKQWIQAVKVAEVIKERIHKEIGEWVRCSIGISYNKLMAKLASDLHKPNGLVMIADEQAAQIILDQVPLDDLCGIGFRIKKRLNAIGIKNFKQLRQASVESLRAGFKSYGDTLYQMARGIDHSPIVPFYEKEEVKSVGHRHTLNHDTSDPIEIKQTLLKLSELVARRLRSKKLVGRTIHCGYRAAFNLEYKLMTGHTFYGEGKQLTFTVPTDNGKDIFDLAWKAFHQIWQGEAIRMIGVSISQLCPRNPQNLSFLEENLRYKKITKALDKINDRFGEFTLQRGILLESPKVVRKANPFLADRRFKL